MDWGRCFNYMTQDENWIKKILVGGVFVLLCFILVGIPFVLGYFIEVVRNVKNGKETPLPEWDDLGNKFVTGLMAFIVCLVYSIPGFIIGLIPCIGSVISVVYSLLVGPTAIIMFAKYGDIGGALKFNEAIEFIKINTLNLILVSILGYVLGILGFLGLIALCVGVLFTLFWAFLGYANLVGQLWRLSEPVPPPAA